MKKKARKYNIGGSALIKAAQQAQQVHNQKVPDLRRHFPGQPGYEDWHGYANNADVATINNTVAADPSPVAGTLQAGLGPSDQQPMPATAETRGTGVYNLHPAFEGINTLALATTGIANVLNDAKISKKERLKYAQSLQSPFVESNPTLNDIPMYAKYGLDKMPYGGGPVTSEGAKEILRDGKVRGKKLTAKQKRYFGYIAGGGKPKGKYGIDAVVDGDHMLTVKDDMPTHERGGVNINDQVEVEAGEVIDVDGGHVSRVLENTSTERDDVISQALKITPQKFEAMFGLKTSKPVSHSDALEKAHKHYAKKENKANRGLERSAEEIEKNPSNYYANNSFDLNIETIKSVPTKDDIFDMLFEHQENVKGMMQVPNGKAKYGGKYLPKADKGYKKDPLDPHPGDKNENWNKSKYTKAQWKKIKEQVGYTGPDDNKKFQQYMQATFPELVAKYHSDTPGGYGMPKVTKKIDDGLLGVRWDAIIDEMGLDAVPVDEPITDNHIEKRPQEYIVDGDPVEQAQAATQEEVKADPRLRLEQTAAPERFNEPLRWFDVAAPLMSLASSGRIPANYNPAEFERVKLKLQNPTPALEAGNRDYNAALGVLPNTGAGMANVTQAFSNKYSLDNQVLGQYENMNSQIKNQEVLYNANVGDRQSVADQQARGVFEQQRLMGIEAQRQQRLTSFDELFTRVALNRKLNREGDLLMQLFPNYNSHGRYNGVQRYMTPNVGNTTPEQNGEGISYITDKRTGKQYPILIKDGKLQQKNKILYGLPK